MESSFKPSSKSFLACSACVSILVLMESSFKPSGITTVANDSGFNPCFNGIFFQTIQNQRRGIIPKGVSILVLMESSFKLFKVKEIGRFLRCFNPCFNGIFFQTSRNSAIIRTTRNGFNPCFNGIFFQT